MDTKLKIIVVIALIALVYQQARSQAYQTLDINNIKAGFNANGALFYDNTFNSFTGFEVPKGSGISTIFAGSLWIGGLDSNGVLHTAARQFRQNIDFFPGPVMNANAYSTANDSIWNRLWKVDRTMIDNHLSNFYNPGYQMPQVFQDWPAHGNVALGQTYYLAPFFDYDQDGNYNPSAGDHPLIKGDQAVYYIFNDDRNQHIGTGSEKLGMEFHAMAYAFDCTQDSALNHTVFLHYDIHNRSANTYDSTYIGTWLDMDLGYHSDDFIGCDVPRGSYYTYNGVAVDGAGGPQHYGSNPPAQACVILKGPLKDADGADNAIGIGPGESLNGFGFGDGIADNESWGMSRFLYHNNNSSINGDPLIGPDYYNYLSGSWKDGTKVLYGGSGHISGGTDTIEAHFMFPGTSDPLGWGTEGVPMPDWSETTSGNVPSDRRGVASSGHFTFAPGTKQSYDLAFVFGRDYDGTMGGSIQVMHERTDAVRAMFMADSTTCGGGFTGIAQEVESKMMKKLTVYPNPANEYLIMDFPLTTLTADYEIYDLMGRLVSKGVLEAPLENKISIQALDNGLHMVKVTDVAGIYTTKFLKFRN